MCKQSSKGEAGKGYISELCNLSFSSIINTTMLMEKSSIKAFPFSEICGGCEGKMINAQDIIIEKSFESEIPKKVQLTLPADRSAMVIMRLTTAGVVSYMGMTLDALEDFKMAAEEACNCILMQQSAYAKINLTFEQIESGVRLQVEGSDGQSQVTQSMASSEVRIVRCILESMVDKVDIKINLSGIKSIAIEKELGEC